MTNRDTQLRVRHRQTLELSRHPHAELAPSPLALRRQRCCGRGKLRACLVALGSEFHKIACLFEYFDPGSGLLGPRDDVLNS